MIRRAAILCAAALLQQGCSGTDDPPLVASEARVFAPLPGRTFAATIHDSVLFDPENRRRDGEPEP